MLWRASGLAVIDLRNSACWRFCKKKGSKGGGASSVFLGARISYSKGSALLFLWTGVFGTRVRDVFAVHDQIIRIGTPSCSEIASGIGRLTENSDGSGGRCFEYGHMSLRLETRPLWWFGSVGYWTDRVDSTRLIGHLQYIAIVFADSGCRSYLPWKRRRLDLAAGLARRRRCQVVLTPSSARGPEGGGDVRKGLADAARVLSMRVFSRLASVAGIGVTRIGDGYGVKVNVQQAPAPGVTLPADVAGVPAKVDVVGTIGTQGS
jgi:hypothetical protein